MTLSAPRLDSRLVAALARIDRNDKPIAETYRRLGVVADALALPRPSYERVRLLVRELRAGRARPGIGDLLLDIALQNKPPESIIDYFSDHPNRAL